MAVYFGLGQDIESSPAPPDIVSINKERNMLRRDGWQLEIALSAFLLILVLGEVAHYLAQVAHSVLGPVCLVMIQPARNVFHLIGTEVLFQRIRRPAPV